MNRILALVVAGVSLLSWTTADARQPTARQDLNIQTLIDQAVSAGGGVVRIPTGTYRLASKLRIETGSGVVLDGQGSTFVFTNDRDGGILVDGGRSVVLQNFSIDFDPLPFTQGVISQVDDRTKAYDIRIDRGYPTKPDKFKDTPIIHVFDPTTRTWKEEATPVGCERVRALRRGIFRCELSDGADMDFSNVQVGDPVALTTNWYAVGITVRRSAETIVRNVTILTAAGAGIWEHGGEGGGDFSYTIRRGPRPPGASVDRLLSTTADGFHSWGTRRGARVHDSNFSFTGDDGLNIQGVMYVVLGLESNAIKVDTTLTDGVEWQVGDLVEVYEATSLKRKGVRSIVAVADDAVTLNSVDGVAPGDWVISPQHGSSGAVVVNNTFEDVEGRGVLMKASGSLIEGNTVRRTTQGGIWVGLGATTVNTTNQNGPFPENVTIRRNTLEDILIGRYARMADQSASGLGAITIASEVPEDIDMSGVRNSRRIDILDNSVTRSGLAGLFLSNASDVTVAGNAFSQTNSRPPFEAGGIYGLKPHAAIIVRDADLVRFRSNTVSKIGRYADAVVQIDPSADRNSIDASGIIAK